MSASLSRRLLGLALVFLLAVAGSGAAVAHRLESGAPEREALALYLALGGKLSDLCGGGGPAGLAHCDACRPLDPATPPSPVRARAEPAPEAVFVALPRPRARSLPDAPPAPARGPPGHRPIATTGTLPGPLRA